MDERFGSVGTGVHAGGQSASASGGAEVVAGTVHDAMHVAVPIGHPVLQGVGARHGDGSADDSDSHGGDGVDATRRLSGASVSPADASISEEADSKGSPSSKLRAKKHANARWRRAVGIHDYIKSFSWVREFLKTVPLQVCDIAGLALMYHNIMVVSVEDEQKAVQVQYIASILFISIGKLTVTSLYLGSELTKKVESFFERQHGEGDSARIQYEKNKDFHTAAVHLSYLLLGGAIFSPLLVEDKVISFVMVVLFMKCIEVSFGVRQVRTDLSYTKEEENHDGITSKRNIAEAERSLGRGVIVGSYVRYDLVKDLSALAQILEAPIPQIRLREYFTVNRAVFLGNFFYAVGSVALIATPSNLSRSLESSERVIPAIGMVLYSIQWALRAFSIGHERHIIEQRKYQVKRDNYVCQLYAVKACAINPAAIDQCSKIQEITQEHFGAGFQQLDIRPYFVLMMAGFVGVNLTITLAATQSDPTTEVIVTSVIICLFSTLIQTYAYATMERMKQNAHLMDKRFEAIRLIGKRNHPAAWRQSAMAQVSAGTAAGAGAAGDEGVGGSPGGVVRPAFCAWQGLRGYSHLTPTDEDMTSMVYHHRVYGSE